MRADDKHASSEARHTRHFDITIPTRETTLDTFSFQTLPKPDMRLLFLPRPPQRSLKRGRPSADIDGEHSCVQKKKRRLRLFLITSRLSPQFSHPATNIVNRGSSKIAVWAKQKSLGRNLLRKAAILNRIRRGAVRAREVESGHGRLLVEQEREQEELKMARLEFHHGVVDTYSLPIKLQTSPVPPITGIRNGNHIMITGSPTRSPHPSKSPSPTPSSPPNGLNEMDVSEYRSPNEAYAYSPPRAQIPRKDYIPLPPSPLGLSNYDAFDVDDDIPNPYSHLDEEEETFTAPFYGDDEEDSIPFSPSAITSATSPNIPIIADQTLPHPSDRDFNNNLGPNDPVFGDYDQIDDGAEPVWPSALAPSTTKPTLGSTSPDFQALFATAPPKRNDSFAVLSSARPKLLFRNTFSTPTPPSTSPNFHPSSHHSIPPTSSNLPAPSTTSPSVSPNFSAIDDDSPFPYYANVAAQTQRRHSMPSQLRPEYFDMEPEDGDGQMEMERKRQRDFMFMRFGG